MNTTRSQSAPRHHGGFTLIELLVVIAIIAILIALLLPAVQAAREAARRSQCTNNLKQLALAALNYESANGCYPPDETFLYSAPSTAEPGGGNDMGFLVRMLPFFEQGPLYNAYNLLTDSTHPSNITIAGVGINTLWCPSDPNMATKWNLTGPDPGSYASNLGSALGYVMPPGTWYQAQTSYGNVVGCVSTSTAPAANGIIIDLAVTTIAGVTDGTSNTMLIGEKAYGWVPQSIQFSDLMLSAWNQCQEPAIFAEYAPNSWRYAAAGAYYGDHTCYSASSLHPGGVNVAFADGSAHFIKDSISSWPNAAPLYAAPPGYFTVSINILSMTPLNYNFSVTWSPTAVLGVWQKLSTRNMGEVISSDSY